MVDKNKPIAKSIGVSNKSSIENAAIAKQINVKKSAFNRPDNLSSVSASAAAIIPKINGVIAVFSPRYQQGITAPIKASNTRTL